MLRPPTSDMNLPSPGLLDTLRDAAIAVSAHAHAPYSRFPVGAACLADDGSIHSGVNVENASSGLTICAERNAVFKAIAAGHRHFSAIALYTPTSKPVTPCGACRQVICEFGEDILVRCHCDSDEVLAFTSGELLPQRFQL